MTAAADRQASPVVAASLPLAQLLGHAADCVQAVRAGQSLTVALAGCPAPARPGAQALSFHALRWLGAAAALRRGLAPKAPVPAVDALLMVALSLLWPPAGSPPYSEHTLVDQTVAAARRRAPRSAGFVNAVLRRYLREREAWVDPVLATPEGRYNHPTWWIDRLRQDWPADWQRILAADNRHPPMTLRVNARRGDACGYVARLADVGIAARALGAQAIALDRPRPVTQLPGFAAGDVSVQDAAAQLAAPLLIGGGLADGARVLDACAAPGGKTAHLLELADVELLALDSDPARLVRIDETLQRLDLRAKTVAGDASDPGAWWDGRPYDRILLDAPCSASGIVRRHPDVRWLRRSTDIEALAATQSRLLEALWPLLVPGGRLLFCTCSVFKAEGQAQIDAFLQRHADSQVPVTPRAPGHLLPVPDNADEGPIVAGPLQGDGFFYALIEKPRC